MIFVNPRFISCVERLDYARPSFCRLPQRLDGVGGRFGLRVEPFYRTDKSFIRPADPFSRTVGPFYRMEKSFNHAAEAPSRLDESPNRSLFSFIRMAGVPSRVVEPLHQPPFSDEDRYLGLRGELG